MELLDQIWNGYYINDIEHTKELHSRYLKKKEGINIDQEIKNCSTELQRVLFLKKYFEWIPVPFRYFERFQKSADLSTLLRNKADKSFQGGILQPALRGYNLAIAFARTGKEELGIAYGSRSALLLQMKEPALALEDIDLALANNCPENMRKELLERQNKCKQLIYAVQKRENRNKNKDYILYMKTLKAKSVRYCDEEFFRLKTQSESIPCAEEFVDIDFKEDRGRRLVVTKDVAAGTLLAVEKPYATVLENVLKWDMEHCHDCSVPILVGIPCKSCSFTLYCSEDCRVRSAAGMHKYEHNYLCYLHCNQASRRDILATRVIGMVGPRELFRLFLNQSLESQEQIKGYNSQLIYDSSSYLPVFHLICHVDSKSCKLISNTFKSLLLMNLLSDTTNFFTQLKGNYTESHSEEMFKDFVASLILHHMENIPFNVISMSKLSSSENPNIIKHCAQIQTEQYGMALFPLLSLANHSCDPNSVPVRKIGLQKTALIITRNLKEGDEIFISYQPVFNLHKTLERQKYLSEKFHFLCQCVACLNHWSPLSSLIRSVGGNECNLFRQEENQSIPQKLGEAKLALMEPDFEKAVELLKPCLEFYSVYSLPYLMSSLDAVDLFKWALIWMVNQ